MGAGDTEEKKTPSPASNGFRVARRAHACFSSEFTTTQPGIHPHLCFPGEEKDSARLRKLPQGCTECTHIRTQSRCLDPEDVLEAEGISLRIKHLAPCFIITMLKQVPLGDPVLCSHLS